MRALIMAKRVIKQIYSDKRSIALMFVAPLLVMFILYTVFQSGTTQPKLGVLSGNKAFIKALKENKALVSELKDEKKARKQVLQGKLDAYLVFKGRKIDIYVEGANPSITKMVMQIIQRSAMKILPFALPTPQVNFIYGSSKFTTFDSFASVLMGFFIFFFVFIISGISFVRERISGTLDRILATPLRRWEIVMGYFLSFGFFVSIQTILLQLFTLYVLHVPLLGSFWLLMFLNLLIATVSLALGLFLSAFARNEFQLFQFIPVVVVPQILFSGLFDLREAELWVQILSSVFPLTYAAEALRDIMIRGYGFTAIYKQVLILFGYAVFFLLLNTWALKKYRQV